MFSAAGWRSVIKGMAAVLLLQQPGVEIGSAVP
jgi:hypothetical protein